MVIERKRGRASYGGLEVAVLPARSGFRRGAEPTKLALAKSGTLDFVPRTEREARSRAAACGTRLC